MSSRRERVLLVEDDARLVRYLERVLSREGYQVQTAADGAQALELARRFSPELVILDLALPGLPGQDVCRRLRSWLAAPILVLSGYENEQVKVEALDAGADDYVTKPFCRGELMARLGALRRRALRTAARSLICSGDLSIDLEARRVRLAGRLVRLTRTEFDILACLAVQPGEIVPSQQIIETVWRVHHPGMHATLRVHVSHLREKLEHPDWIETAARLGYRLILPPGSSQ
jgi:two-component system KDP operon response regulator KdpE